MRALKLAVLIHIDTQCGRQALLDLFPLSYRLMDPMSLPVGLNINVGISAEDEGN